LCVALFFKENIISSSSQLAFVHGKSHKNPKN
jgi:hypothetical protein